MLSILYIPDWVHFWREVLWCMNVIPQNQINILNEYTFFPIIRNFSATDLLRDKNWSFFFDKKEWSYIARIVMFSLPLIRSCEKMTLVELLNARVQLPYVWTKLSPRCFTSVGGVNGSMQKDPEHSGQWRSPIYDCIDPFTPPIGVEHLSDSLVHTFGNCTPAFNSSTSVKYHFTASSLKWTKYHFF